MEVVTGESCVFMATFQIVPIPPNRAAFGLAKSVYPIGYFIMEPGYEKSHTQKVGGVRNVSEGL